MISVCLNCGLHDAGVTILKDNKIIAHIIEERLTNIKHNGSPVLCLEKIKDYVNEIDNVYYHHLMVRHFDPISHIRFLQFKGGFSNQTCQNIENGSVIFEHHKLHAVCGAIFSGLMPGLNLTNKRKTMKKIISMLFGIIGSGIR